MKWRYIMTVASPFVFVVQPQASFGPSYVNLLVWTAVRPKVERKDLAGCTGKLVLLTIWSVRHSDCIIGITSKACY